MASRMIHLAISKLLSEQYEVGDRERFLLGSVIPDAVPKEQSHYFRIYENNTRKTYDLTGFRSRYSRRMDDGLYLGYYMHLIEDMAFRDYFYHTVGYVPSSKKIHRLHEDYSLLNRYIIGRYGITRVPDVPEDIADEPAVKEAGIDAAKFIREMQGDFENRQEGEPVYFTREHADEYIKRAVTVCGYELDALAGKREHIREEELSWLRHD